MERRCLLKGWPAKRPAERIAKGIRWQPRRNFSGVEKIRIVLERLLADTISRTTPVLSPRRRTQVRALSKNSLRDYVARVASALGQKSAAHHLRSCDQKFAFRSIKPTHQTVESTDDFTFGA